MASTQNKKTANVFQDDLDVMLDRMDWENAPEKSIDEGDDFDLALLENAFEASERESELADVAVDKLLMEADMKRPESKRVNVAAKSERKNDIDALLDDIAEDRYAQKHRQHAKGHSDFEFDAFDEMSDNPESLTADVLSIVANKTVEPAKVDAFDQLDDFEVFDEFGEIGGLPGQQNTLSAAKSGGKPAKPESLIDLEENLGVKFNVAKDESDDFEAFDVESDDSAFILPVEKAAKPQHATQPEAPAKPHAGLGATVAKDAFAEFDDVDFIRDTPVAKVPPTKAVPVKSDAALISDDFTVLQDVPDNVENEPAASLIVSGAHAVAGKTEALDSAKDDLLEDEFSFDFDSIADDSLSLSAAAPKVAAEPPRAFAENGQKDDVDDVDDFRDDLETSVAEKGAAPVANAAFVAPKSDANTDPALIAQISELWAAQDQLKQQLANAMQSRAEEDDKMERLDRLSKDRRETKSRKEMLDLMENSSKKIPALVYAAAGVSVLSLLIAGSLLAFGWGTVTEVKALKAHTVAIEEDLTALKSGGSVSASSADVKDESVEPVAESLKSTAAHAINVEQASAADALFQQNAQTKPEDSIRVIAAIDKESKSAVASKKGAAHASTQWVANLVSFKQDWYANRKVAEFAKRGITTLVMPVDVKGETWYLVRSAGFSTQEQALQFAANAKKTLNLTSVLVTQDE
jgi:hypothetical protein